MRRCLRLAAAIAVTSGAVWLGPAAGISTAAAGNGSCDLHYVALGDDVPAGNDISASQAYPTLLLNSHLVTSPGTWCLYGTPANGTTSSQIISGGQLATSWNMSPDLITLQVGEQNSPIENIIDSCFSDVQSHDFAGAAACAGEILGDQPAFDSITKDITTILQQYAMAMSGRPNLDVVVVGYPDPYPSVSSAEENAVQLCDPLVDTEITCETRWQQFPPALAVIHQVFSKLNSTLANAVQPFADGYGGRFMFVDPTSAFSSHCMSMNVAIQTTVTHGEDVEEEDSNQSFGCDSSWFSTHGSGNFDPPTYLEPAESGVLVAELQETTDMGVFPNQDGQQCIADLIWEAAKIKLGIPQAPTDQVCGQSNSTTSDPILDPTGSGTGEGSAGGAAGGAPGYPGAAARTPATTTTPARAGTTTRRRKRAHRRHHGHSAKRRKASRRTTARALRAGASG